MKKLTVIFFFSILAVAVSAQNVGIGSSSFTPDADAILELQSTTSGLLVPRMTNAQRTAMTPTASSDFGLLIYQTDGTDGYYYWDGTVWQFIPNSLSAWFLSGNGSTSPGTDFLGTTDAQDLMFKTNSTQRMTIKSGGGMSIGTNITNAFGSLQISKHTGGWAGAVSTINKANTYLMLGGDESTAGAVYTIGFGYVPTDVGTGTYTPAYLGYITTSNSSHEKGALIFGTRNVTTNTAASERMRIGADGTVGIGTSAATSLLHVSAGTAGDAVLTLEADTDNNDEADNPEIFFDQDGGAANAFIAMEGNAGTKSTGTLANALLIGSEDNNPAVQFITNDVTRMTVALTGEVGINTTTNSNYQLYVATSTDDVTGVFGTASGDNGIGVYGTATGATGGENYGVKGAATGANGDNFGGGFSSSGATTNYGVAGTVSGATGSGYGVHGNNTQTTASNQYGVAGLKTGNTGTGTGYGAYGSATGTATANYGLYGQASGGTADYGVYGKATEGGDYGVYGECTHSAFSGNRYGVYGKADGTSTFSSSYAVYGEKTGNSGTGGGYGLYGTASGSASANYGVYATSSGGTTNYGVQGSATGATGTGHAIHGNNSATAATNQYAVYALKSGNTGTGTGYGVRSSAQGTATTNYGVYTEASGATTNYGLFVNSGETKITDAGASAPTRSADGSIGTSTNGGNRIYYRTGSTNYYVNSDGSGDYSEYFKSSDVSLGVGEIVAIDPNDHNAVRRADYYSYDDEKMIGIVSKFGTRNNDDQGGQRMYDNSFVNVGLLGQVQLKVSTENGNIAPGDALTLSKTKPGYAMKATGECRIIGYSMTHYPYVKGETTYPTHTGSKGEIENLEAAHVMVFVDPGYWKPRAERTASEAITVEK